MTLVLRDVSEYSRISTVLLQPPQRSNTGKCSTGRPSPQANRLVSWFLLPRATEHCEQPDTQTRQQSLIEQYFFRHPPQAKCRIAVWLVMLARKGKFRERGEPASDSRRLPRWPRYLGSSRTRSTALSPIQALPLHRNPRLPGRGPLQSPPGKGLFLARRAPPVRFRGTPHVADIPRRLTPAPENRAARRARDERPNLPISRRRACGPPERQEGHWTRRIAKKWVLALLLALFLCATLFVLFPAGFVNRYRLILLCGVAGFCSACVSAGLPVRKRLARCRRLVRWPLLTPALGAARCLLRAEQCSCLCSTPACAGRAAHQRPPPCAAGHSPQRHHRPGLSSLPGPGQTGQERQDPTRRQDHRRRLRLDAVSARAVDDPLPLPGTCPRCPRLALLRPTAETAGRPRVPSRRGGAAAPSPRETVL